MDDEFDLDARWTGRSGEKRFATLCSDRGVTCNQSLEDDRGWDFFVQFPERRAHALLLDERGSAPAALVQVKSTKCEAHNWSISLSNALHLVRTPLPVFILLYVLGEDNRITIHGSHLWHGDMTRILLAVRQAEAEGDSKLNRRTIQISFNEDNRIANVLQWMRSTIEDIGSDYASKKEDFVKTVGFGRDAHHLTLTVSNDCIDQFLDLQLGLIDSMEAEQIEVRTNRFEIEARSPRVALDKAIIRVTPSGTQGQLHFRASDGDKMIVPATVYYAMAATRGRYKARFAAGCVEIIDDNGKITVDAFLPFDRVVSLDELDLFTFLQAHGDRRNISLKFSSAGGPIDLGAIKVTTGAKDRASWRQMRKNLSSLRRIADYEGVAAVATSVASLGPLTGTFTLVDALVYDRKLTLDFVPSEEDQPDYDVMLAYASVVLDGRVVGVVSSLPVLFDQRVRDRRAFSLGAPQILHAVHGDGEAALHAAYLEEVERLGAEKSVLAIGDLMGALRQPEEGRVLDVDLPRLPAPASGMPLMTR